MATPGSDHQTIVNVELTQPAPSNRVEAIKRQTLLTLSGIGAALGSVATIMRRIKRVSNIRVMPQLRLFPRMRILPKVYMPKYMKSKYFKYPAIMLALIVSSKVMTSNRLRA